MAPHAEGSSGAPHDRDHCPGPDGYSTRPRISVDRGPRVIDGAEILARILHPDIVGPPEPQHAVRVPPELMRASQ